LGRDESSGVLQDFDLREGEERGAEA